MTDFLGWIATGVFVSSYFFKEERHLKLAQILGSCLWIAYGVAMEAPPIVVANILVFSAAAFTVRRPVRESTQP
jgi:hypothetical protein